MSIPDRTKPEDYHFYVNDFTGSDNADAWRLSTPVACRDGERFYSVRTTLAALADTAKAAGITAEVASTTKIPEGTQLDGNIYRITFGGRDDSPHIVITGGIHAREWLSPAITSLVAEFLIKNYHAPTPNEHPATRALRELVDSRRFTIAPIINPRGHCYSVFNSNKDARLWRKNRRKLPTTKDNWKRDFAGSTLREPNADLRDTSFSTHEYDSSKGGRTTSMTKCTFPTRTPSVGVDINRNFPTEHWGADTSQNKPGRSGCSPGSDVFAGPRYASEAETMLIMQLLAEIEHLHGGDLRAAIDVHAFSARILYPTEVATGGYCSQADIDAATRFKYGQQYPFFYNLGTPREMLGYDAVGTLADYVGVGAPATTRSLTLELSPQPNDSNGFNVRSTEIMEYFKMIIGGILDYCAAAGVNDRSLMTDELSTRARTFRGNSLF